MFNFLKNKLYINVPTFPFQKLVLFGREIGYLNESGEGGGREKRGREGEVGERGEMYFLSP